MAQNPYLAEDPDEYERLLNSQVASQLGEKPPAGPSNLPPDTPLVTKPGNEQVPNNPFGPLTLREGTQQPGQTPGPMPPASPFTPRQSGSATGWGYNEPTGGRQEFSY